MTSAFRSSAIFVWFTASKFPYVMPFPLVDDIL